MPSYCLVCLTTPPYSLCGKIERFLFSLLRKVQLNWFQKEMALSILHCHLCVCKRRFYGQRSFAMWSLISQMKSCSTLLDVICNITIEKLNKLLSWAFGRDRGEEATVKSPSAREHKGSGEVRNTWSTWFICPLGNFGIDGNTLFWGNFSSSF